MAADNPGWPEFLDWLDDDPERAMKSLYAHLCGYLESSPPREVHSLTSEERDDLRQVVFLQLVEDDFRVLRSYSEKGSRFDCWLYFVAKSRIYDMFRARTRSQDGWEGSGETGPTRGEHGSIRTDHSALQELETAETLEIVRQCLAEFDEYSQVLLKLGSVEYKPEEMVSVLRRLGYGDVDNVKASNDLRFRRRRLAKMLKDKGIDVEEYTRKTGRRNRRR